MGNEQLQSPVNALVVFHMDGCYFCEITLGSILYNYAHEDIFSLTGVQAFQVLASWEGYPSEGSKDYNQSHVYCENDSECPSQAQSTLGVNVKGLTSFPTTAFYSAEGKQTAKAGLPACGIAVRRDGLSTEGCNS